MNAVLPELSPQRSPDLSQDPLYLPVAKAHSAVAALGAALNVLGSFAPTLSARLLNHLVWCRPARYRLRPADAAALAEATPLPLNFRDVSLPAYSWGVGRAVFLVHGWGGSAGQMAHLARPLVAAGMRVVAFDAPAHGEAPGHNTDFLDAREALVAAVRQCGGAYAIVAHSAASVPVLQAVRRGLPVERLVLLSPFAQLSIPLRAMSRALGLSSRVRSAHLALLMQDYGADVLRAYSPESLVAGLQVPGLIIHDRDDHEFGHANARLLADRWRAQLLITSGLGHYRLLRDEAVGKRIADFLAVPRSRPHFAAVSARQPQ